MSRPSTCRWAAPDGVGPREGGASVWGGALPRGNGRALDAPRPRVPR